MSPKQAAIKISDLASRAVKSAEKELYAAQERAQKAAIQQSSGGHSLEELKALARQRGAGVYSRRRPDGRFDPSKINAQSGKFRVGWRKGTPYRDSAGVLHAPVTNTTPEAQYMGGTAKMIPRPVDEAVVKKIGKSFGARVLAAIDKVLK